MSILDFAAPVFVPKRDASPVTYTDYVFGGTTLGQLQTFFDATVPNGTDTLHQSRAIIPRGTYSGVSGVTLDTRSHITIDGSGAPCAFGNIGGATLTPTGDGSSGSHSGFWLASCNDITVKNLNITGANTNAGTTNAYIPGQESGMGILLYAGNDIVIKNIVTSTTWGDMVCIAGRNLDVDWAQRITVADCTGKLTGRMGIAITAGRYVDILRTKMQDVALSCFDIEPDLAAGGATSITVGNCIIDGYGWDDQLQNDLFVAGPAFGTMDDWIIRDNSLLRGRITSGTTNNPTCGALNILMNSSVTKHRVQVINNVGAFTGPGTSMSDYRNVDVLTVTGNTCLLGGVGSIVNQTSCTNVTISGNTT